MLEDVGVPVPRLPELLEAVAEVAREQDLLIPVIAHAGDGNTHPLIVVPRDDDAAHLRALQAFEDIMQAAIRPRRHDHRRARRRPYQEVGAARAARRGRDGAQPPGQGRARPRRDPQPRRDPLRCAPVPARRVAAAVAVVGPGAADGLGRAAPAAPAAAARRSGDGVHRRRLDRRRVRRRGAAAGGLGTGARAVPRRGRTGPRRGVAGCEHAHLRRGRAAGPDPRRGRAGRLPRGLVRPQRPDARRAAHRPRHRLPRPAAALRRAGPGRRCGAGAGHAGGAPPVRRRGPGAVPRSAPTPRRWRRSRSRPGPRWSTSTR